WLTVAPEGPGDVGIGARVTVTAGGRTTTQIVLAGGSYLAGPPREVYFGLDGAPIAESVRIDWANGTTTELTDVKADQILRVSPHCSAAILGWQHRHVEPAATRRPPNDEHLRERRGRPR